MLSGRLTNVPLGEVFQVLATGHKVGTLEVRREGQLAVLALDRGRIRYANLRPGVQLGEVMIRMELLSSDEVQAILASQTHEHAGAPLGFAALRMGLLDEDDLRRAVRRQVEEVIAELLRWRDGEFAFSEAEVDRTYVPDGQSVDAMAVLMEAVAQLEDDDAEPVPFGAVFERQGDPTAVTLPPGAWELLAQVDGRRSARSIAAEVDLPQRRTLRVLRRLEALGVVRRVALIDPEPTVLVVVASEAQERLLALLVERSGGVAVCAATLDEALEAARRVRPRAVVVDDEAGEGAQQVAALRAEPGLAHLPIALLGAAPGPALRWWRRPRADRLERPFVEAELLGWLERWLTIDAWNA